MARATVVWENVSVEFSADLEEGSHPSFHEVTNVEVERVEILGVKVEFKTLPFDLQAAIKEMFSEADDWS